MSTNKLKAMNACLKGVSSFMGAGAGSYKDQGATTGFAVKNPGGPSKAHAGFRMESFVFGYPTGDNVELFEVNKQRDLLGEGADCAYKCRNIATGKELALKIYDVQGTHRRQILSDLHAHQSTQDHPHIVKYHAVIETEEQIFVLMELIKGIDLFQDVINHQGLSEKRAAKIFAQICDAVKFLHDHDIIHGDMKPENVMIERPDSEDAVAKVIDFGFSCFLNQSNEDAKGAVPNMLQPVADVYAPHEALQIKGTVTKESDMFRLGCCLYVMLMATYPFDRSLRDIENRQAGKVFRYPKWKTLSEDAQGLITSLCRDRISVDKVLEHQWLLKNQ